MSKPELRDYICGELHVGFHLSDTLIEKELDYWEQLAGYGNIISHNGVVSMSYTPKKSFFSWPWPKKQKNEDVQINGLLVLNYKGSQLMLPEADINTFYQNGLMFDPLTGENLSEDDYTNFRIEYEQSKHGMIVPESRLVSPDMHLHP